MACMARHHQLVSMAATEGDDDIDDDNYHDDGDADILLA